MKKLIFLSFLLTCLNADYLYTKNNHCVYDLYPNQSDSGWCYTDRSNGNNYCRRRATIDDFINGYNYVNSECLLKNDLKTTGLTQDQWSYIMAILANVFGFIFLFLVGFSSLKVSKKA